MKVARLALVLALAAAAYPAAGATPPETQNALDCHFAPGWQPTGTKRDYNADNLFEYKDGAAEGYLEYGFVRMRGITCAAAGGNTLDIDISEMTDPDAAYGIFAANADPTQPIAPLGMGGQIQRQSATFAKGKDYVEMVVTAANPASDQSAVLRAFAAAILARLQGRTTPPDVLAWFPQPNLAAVKVVPRSVLGLSQLQHGYVAQYKQGQAFIVPEPSPQAASAVLKTLRDHFPGAVPASVADEGFQAQDHYLGGLCIFRKGSQLAGYANLATPQEAVSLSRQLAARIP
jgi:Family of unknown function (DUF6599)